MNVTDLIKRLKHMDDDKVIIMKFDDGWCNIEDIEEKPCEIQLHGEKYPLFSDN